MNLYSSGSPDVLSLDFDRLSLETEIVGYPVLPLVRQLVEHASGDMGKYIHWGATTQDIVSHYPSVWTSLLTRCL